MPDIWGQAAILAKFLLYIGALGATGLVIVRIVFAGPTALVAERMRKQALGLAALTLVAAGLGFMLRGAALTGGADGMTDPEMLGLLWQTPVGDVLLYRLIGAILMIAGLLIPHSGQWIALVGGLLLLWSFAQIGHVRDIAQTGVRLLLLLHLVGVAFWIGVLSPLHRLSRRPDHLSHAARLGHLFGQAATFIVPSLILAGLVMGWMLLGTPTALITTGYGLALITKIALVAGVLVLAAANKLRFVPEMQAGNTNAARHLAQSIEIETTVILAVFATTATLTSVLTLPN
ncbi:Putative copper export protein [Shimia thalassica]|uniref:Putative copper export protein n=1 Tax=Shimia thalassica TaxID=1715693 RepID=A0A0N7M9Y0_9RHOB|nr:CopD family protein [Shimia thalassica]CUK04980.1 Putative copper export protein [Shimia thalassica]